MCSALKQQQKSLFLKCIHLINFQVLLGSTVKTQFYAVFYQLKSRLGIIINVLKFLTSPSNPFFRQIRVEGYARAIEPELAAHFRKKNPG